MDSNVVKQNPPNNSMQNQVHNPNQLQSMNQQQMSQQWNFNQSGMSQTGKLPFYIANYA